MFQKRANISNVNHSTVEGLDEMIDSTSSIVRSTLWSIRSSVLLIKVCCCSRVKMLLFKLVILSISPLKEAK